MFDFGLKKNAFLGLDVGTSSIKIVELKAIDGRPVLSNYAWMKLGAGFSSEEEANTEHSQAMLSQCIRRMVKKSGFSSGDAYVSLPAFGGLVTMIEFPEMADADMEQAIRFEAHKYIPTSLDEVVISWEVVEKVPGTVPGAGGSAVPNEMVDGPNRVKVLLVAASRKKVVRYEGMIKPTGLRLRSIDIEIFSIARSLIGNDPGTFIIIDIGSRICSIMLVKKGMIRINRNINAGGADMTSTLAKSMNIDYERAEAMKVSDKDFFAADSAISFFTLESITSEVDRIIRAYAKEGEERIDKVILSGGTSRMTGITDYFSRKLGIQTVVGDPFARVAYDEKLKPVIGDIRSGFSVAIGSALKGVDEYLKKNSEKK